MPPTPLFVVEYRNFKTGKVVRSVRMNRQRAEEMAAAVRKHGGRAKIIRKDKAR